MALPSARPIFSEILNRYGTLVDGVRPLLASKVYLGFFEKGKFTLGQKVRDTLFGGGITALNRDATTDKNFPESCTVDPVGDFFLGCWDLGQHDVSSFPGGGSGAAF